MRRHLVVLLGLLLFGTIASAQTTVEPGQLLRQPLLAIGRGSPDAVVARIMSFDHNRNGVVEKSELPERMQDLVTRGDIGRDGTLDDGEIRRLVTVETGVSRRFPFSGGYIFSDEVGLSSRSHIEGALEDLRLSAAAKEAALNIVKTFVDTLEPRNRRTRINATERSALLEQMKDILSDEERDNFRAALERRPLVKAAVISGVVSGVVGGAVNVMKPAALPREVVDGVVVMPSPAAAAPVD